MLLGKSGKNKVRLRDRQKGQVGLRTGSTAPESAGADRDQGLNNLVARTLAIGLRLHKAGQAVALIRLEHVKGKRHHQSSQQERQ